MTSVSRLERLPWGAGRHLISGNNALQGVEPPTPAAPIYSPLRLSMSPAHFNCLSGDSSCLCCDTDPPLLHLNPVHSDNFSQGPNQGCAQMRVGRGSRSLSVSHNWGCAANPVSHGLIGPLTDWGVPTPPVPVSPHLSDGRPALPWTAHRAAPAERSPDSRLHAPPPAQHSLIREHLGNMATLLKSAHLRFTVFVTFN